MQAGKAAPNRHQACQCLHLPARPRSRLCESARLRNGQVAARGRRHRDTINRRSCGLRHACVHGARAGAWQQLRRRAHRPVRRRLSGILVDHRPIGLHGANRHGDPRTTHANRTGAAFRANRVGDSRQLDDVILTCLAKNPDDRPVSADRLAETLASIATGSTWTVRRAQEWWNMHHPKGRETSSLISRLAPAKRN
jgi:hypothetical protein